MFGFFEKDDSEIERDVSDELRWDSSLSAGQITAKVKDGIVTLTGSVPHYSEKAKAEEAAQRVGGVRAVADELEVNLLSTYLRKDEDIASAALNALEWNYSVPKDLNVTVSKGWITLAGEVAWEYQRKAAKDAVSQLFGVCGVSNNLTIKSKVQDAAAIKTRIEESLKRSAESVGRNITVTVEGDRVTLSGKVHSFSDMSDARITAWNSPGVMNVDNNLTVGV